MRQRKQFFPINWKYQYDKAFKIKMQTILIFLFWICFLILMYLLRYPKKNFLSLKYILHCNVMSFFKGKLCLMDWRIVFENLNSRTFLLIYVIEVTEYWFRIIPTVQLLWYQLLIFVFLFMPVHTFFQFTKFLLNYSFSQKM